MRPPTLPIAHSTAVQVTPARKNPLRNHPDAAVPLLRDHIMPKVTLEVIGKGLSDKSNGVDNVALVQVNDAIRNHPIEAVGKVLRGYMKDMKRIAVGG